MGGLLSVVRMCTMASTQSHEGLFMFASLSVNGLNLIDFYRKGHY